MSSAVKSCAFNTASELEILSNAASAIACGEPSGAALEVDLGVAGGGASGEGSFEADFGPFRFGLFFFFFFFCTLAGFGPVVAVVFFSAFAFDFDFWAFLLIVAGAGSAGAAAEGEFDVGL
jgi:hypothetical protein